MKKILLIIAVVLCVAIAGTALASVAYYKQADKTGTVTATAEYLYLSLDDSDAVEPINFAPEGGSATYRIQCDVDTNSLTAAGKLIISIEAADAHNLNGVSVALYEDPKCETEYEVNDTAVVWDGTNDIEINIASSTTIYAKVTFAGAEDADALALVGGNMTISFIKA